MITAPLHPQEEERLKALEALRILDTLPEDSYQQIVQLAAAICDVPVALISLADKERQWFKAAVGLDAKEMPRELAFCAHAILGSEVFSVPDATQDERFRDNPLVTGGPKVRGYHGAPLFSPDGLPLGTLCVIDTQAKSLDAKQIKALQNLSGQVTELLRLRSQLAASEEQRRRIQIFETTFASMNDGMVLQDPSGAITHHNPAALRILGLTEDQLLGRTSLDPAWKTVREDGSALPGEEHPASQVLRTGKPCRGFVMGVHTPDGDLRWIEINSEPLCTKETDEQVWAATVFTDFTEKKKAESSLIQAARLSSLGEMAGGVAHEINTPLAVIMACTEYLRRSFEKGCKEPEKLRSKIAKIDETALRIAHIVRSLNSFAGGTSGGLQESVPLRRIVDETMSFCHERFKAKGISVSVSICDDPRVLCVPGRLDQVLLNLLNNAFDATETLEEKWVSIQTEIEGDRVRLAVIDSGTGIKADVVEKMQEPFFTTKPLGQGSGLGLSIARGLVESLGGRLRYERRNSLTAMVVDLPLCREEGAHGRVA